MRLGKNMRHALEFAKKYAGKWQGFASDRATRNAIQSLQRQGLIEVNEFQQFRVKP